MKKILFAFIILVILSCYSLVYLIKINKDIAIEVKKGSNLYHVATDVYPDNFFMRNIFLLYGKSYFFVYKKKLQCGEYEIKKSHTISKMIKKFSNGSIKYYKITFPEGITTEHILDIIKNSPILDGEIDNIEIKDGSLMPDTYKVVKHYQRTQLIETMKNAMTEFIEKEWKNREQNLLLKTPYEAIILASMVEKEVGASYCEIDEYTNIAAVFINRLKKRMRLESSPTVFYGLNIEKIKHNDVNTINRNPTFAELQVVHPYNTYRKRGLPPTPICNPSKKAIIAVLHPANTDALFFISDGNNCHIFNKDFEDHKKSTTIYRKIRRKKIKKTL